MVGSLLNGPLVFFFVFLKKITTGSSANFLCPEPNGQGYQLDDKVALKVNLKKQSILGVYCIPYIKCTLLKRKFSSFSPKVERDSTAHSVLERI